jgi:hypothetical protein
LIRFRQSPEPESEMNTPILWNCIEGRTLIHIETHSPTKGEHIASVPKKQKKNARLIVASPRLLAALKSLVANQEEGWRSTGTMPEEHIQQLPYLREARAAIAEAEEAG